MFDTWCNDRDSKVDALTYSVFYSRDGGQSWELLANELEASSLEIDTDRMAGSSNARFRVAASDGVNTGVSDMSAAVQIPNKPPVATIMDPRNGVRVPTGSLVVLLGTALDLEDGMLDDGALSWSRGGVSLGTGSTIPVLLDQPGTYTFELRVTDGDGLTGVATTTVLVGSVDTPTVTPSPSAVGQAVVASARARCRRGRVGHRRLRRRLGGARRDDERRRLHRPAARVPRLGRVSGRRARPRQRRRGRPGRYASHGDGRATDESVRDRRRLEPWMIGRRTHLRIKPTGSARKSSSAAILASWIQVDDAAASVCGETTRSNM